MKIGVIADIHGNAAALTKRFFMSLIKGETLNISIV